MTDDAAAIVYAEIQKTDVLTGAKMIDFQEGINAGLISYVGDDCKEALYDAIKARSVRPGLCKTAGLKLVYSPLNGSGLVPVTRVLRDIGITDITVVPEQKDPDGNFPTCPYPNPEIFEALRLGLELAKKSGADLMLATDPDADRVGIAIKCPDGCQMTDDAAAIVYAEIQKTDILTGAKMLDFEEGVKSGMIQYVGEDCKEALYDAIKARSVRPGLCKTAG